MKLNRRSIAAGLTVGLLAGGAGGAIAATTSGSRTTSAPWTTPFKATAGWQHDRYGWSGGGRVWRTPATGSGWGGWDGWRGGPDGPTTGAGW